MAVARIHGKVKCIRFKERGRRALLTEHGITGNGLLFSVFLSLLNLNRSSLKNFGQNTADDILICLYFYLETGCNGWQSSKAQTCLREPYEQQTQW